jgi:hypothetical protein
MPNAARKKEVVEDIWAVLYRPLKTLIPEIQGKSDLQRTKEGWYSHLVYPAPT